MLKVITTQVTNAKGHSQILAKGNGRQATVSFDQNKSADWNHGNAAGVLALKLGLTRTDVNVPMTHTTNDKGSHLFSIG